MGNTCDWLIITIDNGDFRVISHKARTHQGHLQSADGNRLIPVGRFGGQILNMFNRRVSRLSVESAGDYGESANDHKMPILTHRFLRNRR